MAGTRRRTAIAALALGALIAFAASTSAADPLPSWNDSPSRTAITGFVERVTREGSADFVVPSERIAVFDNDGTLWAEQPIYFQLAFMFDRIRELAPEHPEWKTQEPFAAVLAGDPARALAGGNEALMKLAAATHAGISSEAFDDAARQWLTTARHPKTGRLYTEMVYQPMLEVLAYLRANGFKTFIVSGGGIDFLRLFAEEVYGIPPEQVVGTSMQASYEVRDGVPTIVKQPELDFLDDGAGKPVAIHLHIGRRPIAAFGNSDGDFQMIEWTTAGPGARLGVLVHHDDAEREWAYDRDSHIGRLVRGLDESAERGWVLVGMKDDWKSVFPSKRD